MLRLSLVVVSLLVASSVSAQTVERYLNLPSFGMGTIREYRIDADGDPATEEYALEAITPNTRSGSWRVATIRDGRICLGEWFDVRQFGDDATIEYARGRSVLVVRQTGLFGYYMRPNIAVEIRFDIPPCQ